MSRIGNKPISVPSGVEVQIKDSVVEVKGPKGLIMVQLEWRIKIEKEKGKSCIKRLLKKRQIAHFTERFAP